MKKGLPYGRLLVLCFAVFDIIEDVSTLWVGVDFFHVFRAQRDFTDEVEWGVKIKIRVFGAFADVELGIWVFVRFYTQCEKLFA